MYVYIYKTYTEHIELILIKKEVTFFRLARHACAHTQKTHVCNIHTHTYTRIGMHRTSIEALINILLMILLWNLTNLNEQPSILQSPWRNFVKSIKDTKGSFTCIYKIKYWSISWYKKMDVQRFDKFTFLFFS